MAAPQAIVDTVLSLSKDERVDLIHHLVNSIDSEKDIDWNLWEPEFRDALIAECERRWTEFEQGEAEPIPYETVMEEIKGGLPT